MAIATGLLALALVAAEGPSCAPYESTTFQVRVLTLDGLEWRTSSYSRLQPVARQGMSAIWTADKALAASLADRATSAPPAHTITAIGEAELTRTEPVYYIAAMDRVADGPINQSSAIAFMPRPEQVEERFAIRVSGRKLDQGVLTRITLEDSHVDVIHKVAQSEALKNAPGKASRTPAEVGGEILRVVMAPASADERQKIATYTQIPEVSRARVEGEWLIPNDGVLLVSLGVKTAADDKGMAVVRERVAVIEARTGADVPVSRGAGVAAKVDGTVGRSMFAPAIPSRSMPEAVDAHGHVVDLPPLPEALASADLNSIGPDSNRPSPQTPILSSPSADPALARTNFDAAPTAPKGPSPSSMPGWIQLDRVMEALAKAGVNVDIDVDPGDILAARPKCEKCDAEAPSCPLDAKAARPGPVAGGLKLTPFGGPQVGISIVDEDGAQVLNTAVMDEVFKTAGRTETTVLPLKGRVSLEIKATLVPTPTQDAKRPEGPAAKR